MSKAELRQHYKRLRSERGSVLQARFDAADDALWAQLLSGSRPLGSHVGLTWPLPGEPDLRPWLAQMGRPLALPAVTAGRLVYRPWQPGMELAPDDCGIPAPKASSPDLEPGQLALLLVPALAIDRRGLRLGYGGGWYDRLRAEPGWRAVPALAVLPAACRCEQLPSDPWDVPFDGWLDEQGCHWLKALPPAGPGI